MQYRSILTLKPFLQYVGYSFCVNKFVSKQNLPTLSSLFISQRTLACSCFKVVASKEGGTVCGVLYTKISALKSPASRLAILGISIEFS